MGTFGDQAQPRGDRIQDAFAHVVGLDALSRRAYLERLRSDQPDVVDEVESLLQHHGRTGFMGMDEPTGSIPSSLVGAFVAGCTVERLIGYGGMSAVYAAVQDFPRRRVALKIVRRERLGQSARRRLRVEAEALARLEHPSIARVYAAGAERLSVDAEHESPYIVMELVDGALPLTRWADRAGLDARARIELVAMVAEAIDHAHRAGVIHRDLKPGNVIVGDDGVPRVIDFGIAAVTDPSVTAATDVPMGTLAYMSPEQARGEAVDTRSDVWGLGALLHDVLCGQPPFAVEGRGLAEHVERLLHDRPVRVSAAAEARGAAFVRTMPTGIDEVVAKALATDPAERYASAREFGDDVRRLLAGHATHARPDSSWRAGLRFMRRHRVLVGTAASVAVVGIAALALTSLALERASRAAYANAIWAAWGMLERADAGAAHDMLMSADPARRGWEWRHLAARCDQSTWSSPALGQVYGVDWTGDGRVLAASSAGFQCIDPSTGRQRWAASTPDGMAWRVAGSADGGAVGLLRTTALVSYDASGVERARLVIDGAHDLASLPDRRSVFVLREEYVQELDGVTLAESERLSPTLPAVARELSISPDGSLVALGDMAGHVSVMDRRASVRWTVRVPGAPEVIGTCFSPDGSMVAAVGGQTVALLSAVDGAVQWASTSGRNGAHAVCFTPDGQSMLVGGWTEVIERLRVRDGASEAFIAGAFSQVWSIAPEPAGVSIATGCLRAVVQRFPMDGQLGVSRQLIDQMAVRSVVAIGGDRVLASTVSGAVVAQTATGDLIAAGTWLSGGARHGPAAAEGGDEVSTRTGQILARAGDGRLCVAHGASVHWIEPDGSSVALEARGDGARVLDLAMQDGWTAVLWSDGVQWILRSGQPKPVHEIRGCSRGSRAALVDAPHGRAIVFRGADALTTVLDLTSGAESPAPFQIEHPLRGSRSPDGSIIAIGSMDQGAEVALLDAVSLRVLQRCAGHRSPITALAWIGDGSRLASASNDGTVRVWETDSMREALTPLAAQVFDLCWTADGTLWAAGADGTLYRMMVR